MTKRATTRPTKQSTSRSSGRSRKVSDLVKALARVAPPALAAEWDNVGLLLGDAQSPCERVLLTIDLTEEVMLEARELNVQAIIAYHPRSLIRFASLFRMILPLQFLLKPRALELHCFLLTLRSMPSRAASTIGLLKGLAMVNVVHSIVHLHLPHASHSRLSRSHRSMLSTAFARRCQSLEQVASATIRSVHILFLCMELFMADPQLLRELDAKEN